MTGEDSCEPELRGGASSCSRSKSPRSDHARTHSPGCLTVGIAGISTDSSWEECR
ncbi:MAG: hypothetical protein QOF52_962 [Propionibacteriaceae bacterium]|jgi:hypothetical protein|nr:hypothetical protein [Propionibacteriaceae bacterium]